MKGQWKRRVRGENRAERIRKRDNQCIVWQQSVSVSRGKDMHAVKSLIIEKNEQKVSISVLIYTFYTDCSHFLNETTIAATFKTLQLISFQTLRSSGNHNFFAEHLLYSGYLNESRSH